MFKFLIVPAILVASSVSAQVVQRDTSPEGRLAYQEKLHACLVAQGSRLGKESKETSDDIVKLLVTSKDRCAAEKNDVGGSVTQWLLGTKTGGSAVIEAVQAGDDAERRAAHDAEPDIRNAIMNARVPG